MFGWAEIKSRFQNPKVEAPTPAPAPAPQPVQVQEQVNLPPPAPPLMDTSKMIEAVDNAIDAAFSKKKKIPQPHSCGGCGGIVWA